MNAMDGKTVLVTGATSGIGLETSRQLAAIGARVLVHGRSPERAAGAAADVVAHGPAEAVWADFGNLAQVRDLAEQVRDLAPRLDVLINNAGIFLPHRTQTVDGHETTFQVNHLSPFLLTNLLLGEICSADQGRVVTVSSVAHFRGSVDFEDLEHERSYEGYRAYADTKLMNVLFAQELAERLKCESATSNALHPGTVTTKLLAIGFPYSRGMSPAQGAETPVYLASSPEVAGISERYFVDRRSAQPSPKARDLAVSRRLWELSAQMVGL